jgi:hypothetical protein
MRRSISLVWRRLTRRPCLVPGCHGEGAPRLCVAHWKALPLSHRQRWWDETRYGHGQPSDALVRETIDVLRK